VLGIGFVHGLLELDASFNRLSVIPKTLEECAELKVLKLSDNNITNVTEAIEGNEELRVLDLG
jgi:Leucine-rich repeat (LRR) protein